jgi:hypothetical protein
VKSDCDGNGAFVRPLSVLLFRFSELDFFSNPARLKKNGGKGPTGPPIYVDDGIFLGNDDSKLQDAICNIQDAGLNIEDQGHSADYVGVNIKKAKDGSYEFTQRALIDSIIEDIEFKDAKVKPVPAKASQ